MNTKVFRCKSQEVVIMKTAILATKVGMTQIFSEDGVSDVETDLPHIVEKEY